MHFRFPRRHRRRRLFPPGLLALAGLLWLGCLAVKQHERQWRPKYVLALTMPTVPIDGVLYPGYGEDKENSRQSVRTYNQLNTLYSWEIVRLNGRDTHDASAISGVLKSVLRQRNDTIPNCGILIHFSSETHYESIVKLINLMNVLNQKKYYFDIHHGLPKLYILVDNYRPIGEKVILLDDVEFVCGYKPLVIRKTPPVPFWVAFDNQVTAFWQLQWLAPFRKPEWRTSLALLGLLAALSGWRMVRAWHTA